MEIEIQIENFERSQDKHFFLALLSELSIYPGVSMIKSRKDAEISSIEKIRHNEDETSLSTCPLSGWVVLSLSYYLGYHWSIKWVIFH